MDIRVEFRLLGPLQVLVGGAPAAVGGAAERALLALLLLDAGRVVPADILIDSLWAADLPRNALNALQGRVSRLRQALRGVGLPAPLVVSRRPGYLVDVDPVAVDVHRFTRLVEQARGCAEQDRAAAGGRYAEALGLWHGPALAEFDADPWARPPRQHLEETRLAALEEWLELRLAGGQDAELVGQLTALVAEHPLRERLHGQLMVALYRSGRQADALAAYQRARQLLGEELGLDPSPQLRELEQAMLRQDAALGASQRRRAPEPEPDGAFAPRLTSFLGRESDQARLRELLGSRRLVTLTGPGGVGKTSLAVETARTRPETTWCVPLAGVAEPAGLAPAVADVVGAPAGPGPPEQRVRHHLRQRRALLVLDNCEHLAPACAELARRLLTGCPGLRLLATSREPLMVAGEAQYPVTPLPLPPTDAAPAELGAVAAVRLFVDRARDADPEFTLDEASAPAVVEICRRLDGLPLAIELAAARVKLLPVDEIAARLDDRFRLLTGGPRTADARQRTLRAAVDWSHELLTGAERVLFRRLSVFRGGWILEAAEEVCVDPQGLRPSEILDLHSRLVDRSLVVARRDGGARFDMLDTLRQYAEERLDAAGEQAPVAAGHAAYFTRLATRAGAQLRGPGQDQALAALREERDNLRSALAWGRAHPDAPLGLNLAGALGWFWYFTGAQEGVAELEAAVAAAPAAPGPSRARALQALAVVARPGACIVHPDPRCADAARASLDLFTADGDAVAAAYSTTLLAVEGINGAVPAALAMLDEADREFVRVGDEWGRALALFVRMELKFLSGDPDAATAHGAQALRLFDALDDHWGVSAVQYHHGLALHRAGRLHAALAVHEAALARGRRGLTNTVPYVLADLGHIMLELGDPDGAARHFGESHVVARRLGGDGSAAAALGEGHLARDRGDLRAAARHYQESQRLLSAQATPEWAAAALNGLGFTAALRGDLDAADAHHRAARQAAARAPGAGARAGATALEGLAVVACGRGDGERAAELLGTAAAWRQRRHQPALRRERRDIDRATALARELLDERRFHRAYARGLHTAPEVDPDT